MRTNSPLIFPHFLTRCCDGSLQYPIWFSIQIQIHFSNWIENPIQIQSQSKEKYYLCLVLSFFLETAKSIGTIFYPQPGLPFGLFKSRKEPNLDFLKLIARNELVWTFGHFLSLLYAKKLYILRPVLEKS